MPKNLIKMIKILILINTAFVFCMAGCSGSDNGDGENSAIPSSSVEGASTDTLKQMQDEGKLPTIGTGNKAGPTVLSGGGPEVLSLYPPNIDPDQDNVPNGPITGHPEIKVDNCPTMFNPGQEDANHNGIGDACE